MGIVCITTIESATPSLMDLLRHDLLANPEPITPREIGSTAQVQSANRYRGTCKIVASSPAFDAELCFSPDAPKEGHYSIRHKPRGPTEHGDIVHVHAVSKDEQNYKISSVLSPYEIRFAVQTIASARPRNTKLWLLGLSSINTVEDEPETENGQS
jgi:hypothetical protein